MKSYDTTGASQISRFYNIPKLTGTKIWSDQIKQNVKDNILKTEQVLGDNWNKTQKGKEISQFVENFLNKFESQE